MKQEHALCDRCPQPRTPMTVVAFDMPRLQAHMRLCPRCLLDAFTALATGKPFVVLGAPAHLDPKVSVKAIISAVFLTTSPWVGGGDELVQLIVEVLDELMEEGAGATDDDPGVTLVH